MNPKAICKCCNKEFIQYELISYCSVDCQVKEGIYQDRIDYMYTKLVATLDCGDNSCRWRKSRGGMRTNGGCRCFKDLINRDQALAITRLLHTLGEKYDQR